MQIELQQLVPVPLKEKLGNRKSDIWNSHILLNRPEWIKIVAPSGTGKTTLINFLYKLRYDYEGTIKLGGNDLRSISGDRLAKLRQQNVSIIFQDLRLFENLTARENIELNRVLQNPYYQPSQIEEFATQLGITHILDQKARICSYGEQQRIAIIRALVQPFEWLMMDEPFSHLDVANTKKAADLILSECRKRNAGFILTDLDEDALFPYSHLYQL